MRVGGGPPGCPRRTYRPAAPRRSAGRPEGRRPVEDLVVGAGAIGELLLEVAPAYLPDTDAAEVLAPLCDETGIDLEAPQARPEGGGCDLSGLWQWW
jgi:hypothetical protein